MEVNTKQQWTKIISPKRLVWKIDFAELWRYRDLLFLFVKRDFVSVYKQTILGPLWFILQPLLTTLMFAFIFGRVAKIPVGDVPIFLFYLAGNICWSYLSECLLKTSNTFSSNAGLFGKVYFPRLITPISVTVSNLFKFGVQLVLFLIFWMYYKNSGAPIEISAMIFYIPILIIFMAMFGLGMGLILSALTTKYRDLKFLIGFAIQLWMFASPIIYPYTSLSGTIKEVLWFNPATHLIEFFKYAFFGQGYLEPLGLFYTMSFILITFFVGVVLFNKVEKNFMDTV